MVFKAKLSNPEQVARTKKFYVKAFGRPVDVDPTYFGEWVSRFESPRRAWSSSDFDRRRVLKKLFPEKFGKLNILSYIFSYPCFWIYASSSVIKGPRLSE